MADRKEYLRAYYEAHKAERREANKKYQAARREDLNAYRRQWRAEHPEKVAEYNRRYHEKQRLKREGTESTEPRANQGDKEGNGLQE